MIRHLQRFWRDDRGAVVVDHIPVFFVLTIIVMIIMELGIAHFLQLRAQKAVQLGARVAVAIPPAAPGVPTINEKVDDRIGRSFPCYSNVGPHNCKFPDQFVWSCTGAKCTGNDGISMTRIVNDMRRVEPSITLDEVTVTYIYRHLGNAGEPLRPQVNVSIGNRSYDFAFLSLGGGAKRKDNPPAFMVDFVADFETHEATIYSGVSANAFGESLSNPVAPDDGTSAGTPPSADDT